MRYITFALAKGRLAKKAMALLEEIGITCEEMKDEKTRKLIFVNEELKLKFFLSKASDVPTYVEYGAADIGVVGKDTILEEGRNLYEVLDLKFGACKMCVCGPKEAKKYLNSNEIIRVASKYPHIAKEYFNNQKLQTVEIVKLNGSVELAPIVGLSEVIVDIVETGTTLKENGLEVLEEVCPLSARMVVNQVSQKMEQERISKIIVALKKILDEKNRSEERNMRIVKVNKDSIANILSDLLKRSPTNYGDFQDKVDAIIKNVRDNGDKAVFDYTAQFDKAEINAENILVTEEEIKEAYEEVDDELIKVIRKAIKNIRDFHEKQIQKSWFETREDGVMLGQKVTPMETCGVYVPGGKAVYPSSVLMNIVPAHVAGVKNIIMTTPPGKDGKVTANTLVAAKEAGATKVYKVGGAQAIAAMAFGTESIPKVDKIVGPGNIFVALAKKAVYGNVSIDSIAGPSEILVLADETANPRYVAADLLSQAEHDEMASAILVTTSEELAHKVSDEIDGFLNQLSRKEIMEKSLDSFGYILVASDMKEAIDTANAIASEHMEIMTANPFDVMTRIKNAGAIFIGAYSCEPLGDYFAGPNHVLPTNGTAKFFSPLSVDDFIKKSSVIYYSREALEPVHKDIEFFANQEQLTAHANSMKVRFEDNQEG